MSEEIRVHFQQRATFKNESWQRHFRQIHSHADLESKACSFQLLRTNLAEKVDEHTTVFLLHISDVVFFGVVVNFIEIFMRVSEIESLFLKIIKSAVNF